MRCGRQGPLCSHRTTPPPSHKLDAHNSGMAKTDGTRSATLVSFTEEAGWGVAGSGSIDQPVIVSRHPASREKTATCPVVCKKDAVVVCLR